VGEWDSGIKSYDRMEIGREIFELAWDIFTKYEDKKLSFTDCNKFCIDEEKRHGEGFCF